MKDELNRSHNGGGVVYVLQKVSCPDHPYSIYKEPDTMRYILIFKKMHFLLRLYIYNLMCSTDTYCKDDLDSSLFSTYTTPRPL